MAELQLNERQKQALTFVKTHGRIDNSDYQKLLSVSKPTASRDLEQLRSLGVLEKIGHTGKGTYYVLARKGLTNGSKGSAPAKGSQRAQTAHPAPARAGCLPNAPRPKPARRRPPKQS
ncbi:MAG TPA: DeoR family transcriptional regulator [Candidatus Paceibacterota bacterium]|nr:DeoR family transcriptional regulator [Verrucomicrobiota bacterium]HSA12941.1 DeoR family transcriptional regulator [Candidatus Paceibacterota bacterium]